MVKWYNGDMKNWLKKFGVAILFAILTIFLVIWLSYTIFILQRDSQLAEAYTAVSTLILASVTAFLAFFTYLSVKSGYDREKRDRKERLLNEIIEWAIDVNKCELELSIAPVQTGITDQSLLAEFTFLNLLLKYRNVDARSEYVKQIASNFGKVLQVAAEKTTSELAATEELLLEHPLDATITQQIRDHRESLELLAIAVIKEATKIKTGDIG
jgi:hypothetical protein